MVQHASASTDAFRLIRRRLCRYRVLRLSTPHLPVLSSAPTNGFVPSKKVLLVPEPGKAREIDRQAMAFYLSLSNYHNNWKGFGSIDARRLSRSGSIALCLIIIAPPGIRSSRRPTSSSGPTVISSRPPSGGSARRSFLQARCQDHTGGSVAGRQCNGASVSVFRCIRMIH